MNLSIEKLVDGGQGLARQEDGRVVFVWNALPGEHVLAEPLKQKHGQLQAVAVDILDASPDRVPPTDTHFLSSAPWQMMSWEAELSWKQNIAAETYSKIGDLIVQPDQLPIVTDNVQSGYRNKMEFSFAENDAGEISLALFKRGTHHRMPVEHVSIASDAINTTAAHILAWVREQQIPLRSLKGLIVRSAGTHTIAALFIKDELFFEEYPELTDTLRGFQLYYSTHKSPASVPTKLLHAAGQDYLEETILGTTLRYGLLSFFQINPSVFTLALQDIAAFLDPKQPLVDFYSGVGAIGLPLAGARTQTTLVESNEEAAAFALQNIARNDITNATAHALPSEKMLDAIAPAVQIVLDPPRAGLHEHVVRALLQKKPKKIIYLSCNIATHARDVRMLASAYRPVFTRLYNFFPRTPHIEGLIVLEALP